MAGYNSPFSSNTGISSLVKAAESAAKKAQDYQDALVAFQWDNSAKTFDDYQAYSKYLTDRAASTTDPNDLLKFQKTQISAQKGYTANQIQRETQAVYEGTQSLRDKYAHIEGLYYDAVNNGLYDYAQTLHSTLDSLSIQIQNEATAGAAAARASASELNSLIKKGVQDNIDSINNQIYEHVQQFKALGEAGYNKMLKEQGYQTDFFGLLATAAEQKLQQYQAGASQSSDPAAQNEFLKAQQKIQGFYIDENGQQHDVKPDGLAQLPGVGTITYRDVQEQVAAKQTGQSKYIQKGDGTFKEQKITGYAYGRDTQGNQRLVPIYGDSAPSTVDPNVQGTKTQTSELTYDSKTGQLVYGDKKFNTNKYEDLLRQNGFEVTGNNSGLISVKNNGQFDSLGVSPGEQVQLLVSRDGHLQIVRKNGTKNDPYDDRGYILNFDNETGKYLGTQQQSFNPFTGFGDQLSAPYLNTLDYSKMPGNAIAIAPNVSGPAFGLSTPGSIGDIAQQLTFQSNNRLAALQAAAPVPTFQPANATFQQTANPQLLPSNKNTKVTVAAPQALPNINLPKPKPLPNIQVSTKPASGTVNVAKPGNTGSIMVGGVKI